MIQQSGLLSMIFSSKIVQQVINPTLKHEMFDLIFSAMINTITTTTTISSTLVFTSNESNTTLINTSTRKFLDVHNELPSSTFLRQNLFALILYLICALIALTLLIILFSIIIFTYRKHCFPSPSSSPILDHRYRLGKHRISNRVGIQVEKHDRESQDVKTMDTTVRPCFE